MLGATPPDPDGVSLLGAGLVGGVLRRLRLTLCRLFLFPGRSGVPLARRLNYDVVLNVELIVHVHNVDFHTLPALLPLGVVCLLGPAFHIGGNNPLHVEELLVSSCPLDSFGIRLMLDILSRVSPTHAATYTSRPARWLR